MRKIIAITVYTLTVLSQAASAQNLDFQVENFSLEQIVTSGAASTRFQQPLLIATPSITTSAPINAETISVGSNSVILQGGSLNFANTFITRSPGSNVATLQQGGQNKAYAIIDESPESDISQVQLGQQNFSVVGIFGGKENTVSTAQIGAQLEVAVGLVDSIKTKVVYGQAGTEYSGGIIIRNAPPGTVIRLN